MHGFLRKFSELIDVRFQQFELKVFLSFNKFVFVRIISNLNLGNCEFGSAYSLKKTI
jgi:hypothetical protein